MSKLDLSKVISEPHAKASISINHILLRLNPGDSSAAQKALIQELNQFREHFNSQKYADACNGIQAIREKSQVVLKAEWERVKRGERTFRWSKRIALFFLLSAIALGGFFTWEARSRLSSGATTEQKDNISR